MINKRNNKRYKERVVWISQMGAWGMEMIMTMRNFTNVAWCKGKADYHFVFLVGVEEEVLALDFLAANGLEALEV